MSTFIGAIQPALSDDLLIQIETIKNLFLYSWYVYRFGMVGKSQTANVLEMALSIKFEQENVHPLKGLNRKLEKALAEGWFDENAFDHITLDNNKNVCPKTMVDRIVYLRNELNHGSSILLDPYTILGYAQDCLAIINALFPLDKTERNIHDDFSGVRN